MRKESGGAGHRFAAALTMTLLAAAAVSGILLALVRMEDTMNAGGFTLFSMRETGNVLLLTALNREYEFDLQPLREISSRAEGVFRLLPPEWEVFSTGVSETVELLSRQLVPYL